MNNDIIDSVMDDCKIIIRKYGDIPINQILTKVQRDFRIIGMRHGISGSEVFRIFMDNQNRSNFK